MSEMTSERRAPSVVVGYDGSDAARAAVRQAVARAGKKGKVLVLHSVGAPTQPWVVAGAEFLLEDPEEHGRAMLDALLMEDGALAATDVDVELRVAHGDPAKAIVAAARELDAAEIVVGTRGAGRIGSLLGSVAQGVLHRADRPVVVIPANAVAHDRAAGAAPPAPAVDR